MAETVELTNRCDDLDQTVVKSLRQNRRVWISTTIPGPLDLDLNDNNALSFSPSLIAAHKARDHPVLPLRSTVSSDLPLLDLSLLLLLRSHDLSVVLLSILRAGILLPAYRSSYSETTSIRIRRLVGCLALFGRLVCLPLHLYCTEITLLIHVLPLCNRGRLLYRRLS